MGNDNLDDLGALAALADAYRQRGKRVVLCHGTFDLLHVGHIRHLKAARAEGDVLFATITADAFVSKGPGRPVFNEQLRAESLHSLSCVDHVGIIRDVTAMPAIEAVKPGIYVKGSDYRKAADDPTGNIVREQMAVEAHGGRIVFTDDITFSSSNLLNEHFSIYSQEVKEFLARFREEFSPQSVTNALKQLEGLKVCVVGDAIIDEYHYTDPMGQTGKGYIMAAMHRGIERFAGGSLAVANHIAGFCKQVTLVTGLGRQDSHEDFIREKLADHIDPVFFYREDAPTLRKTRFVDREANKLFEVYFYEDSPAPPDLDAEICAWLNANLAGYDVVVVPDFGNRFISRNMVGCLVKHSKFLAVNAQINSGNRGFHAVNRYHRADFVSLNEPELRLAVHNRTDNLETVARDVAKKARAEHLAVTLGTQGLVMLDVAGDRFDKVPALSIKVVDRIGAGDAFLSLSALCLGAGQSSKLAAFIGAVAAAMDVQIVCNREPVDPVSLIKFATTLLK